MNLKFNWTAKRKFRQCELPVAQMKPTLGDTVLALAVAAPVSFGPIYWQVASLRFAKPASLPSGRDAPGEGCWVRAAVERLGQDRSPPPDVSLNGAS